MQNSTVFVLLAGGKSERMKTAKGLLVYQNTLWILEQLNRISYTSISEVYIGLGFNYESYFAEIPWFNDAQYHFQNYNGIKVKIVINATPELGSFSTIQAVLNIIPKNKSVFLNPIDIPILNFNELQKLIDVHNKIVLPSFEGKNGHPIKLSPIFWNQLLLQNSDDTNKRLDLEIKKVHANYITKVEVKDSSILKNLNTKSDWLKYLKFINLYYKQQ